MRINTKYFGQIDIEEEKIIEFEAGLFGFEELKKYTILYDIDKQGENGISWLQCVEEEGLALPIISPLAIMEDYVPSVNEELLKSLGDLNEENLAIYLVMTVPRDVTKMSVNLKAPLVINMDTKKAVQAVADNSEYTVKYNVYQLFEAK